MRTATSSLGLDEHKVHAQLERILESQTFHTVDRLKRFLRFIVIETLEGRGDQLKEYVIGIHVFGKDDSFDPRSDPIVRVQARRLRGRLARYYADEGHTDELLVELPKGAYSAVLRRRDTSTQRRSVAATLVSRNTIHVTAFEDLSREGDLDWLSKGICQEIIHALAGLESLQVIAQDFGGQQELLEAAAIVKGSVQRNGNIVRITSQIVDVASGVYIWSERIAGKLENPLELLENVAESIRKKLSPGVYPEQGGISGQRPPGNLAAYNLYQQGRYHLEQRTEEGLRKAAEFFEKVLAEDPHYARAYAGLADAYGLLGHYGALSPAEVWTKAASNAAAAVMEDDNLSEAHTSLAHVKATQDWDWRGAEAGFRRAVQLDPRNATAHHWYALACLAPVGRLDEAVEEITLAQTIEPTSSIIARDCAMVYYYRRDFEETLERCDQAVELNPYFSPAYWVLGLTQQQRGDFEEAAAAIQRALQFSPGSPRLKGALGRTYALWGKRSQAIDVLEELDHVAIERYVSPFEFASLHFALGNRKVGFAWLHRAFEYRCFELTALKVDPRFDEIRDEPEFQTLASRMNID
jgi:serine/threonine-protein kinase